MSLFKNEVLGLRTLRSSISDIFDKVTNSYTTIQVGNVKKKGSNRTVTIICTELLDTFLETYTFNPVKYFDNDTKDCLISISILGVQGFGKTEQDAINMLVDNIVALTEDYFSNLELYMRLDDMRGKYPYFLRLSHCSSKEDIIKLIRSNKKLKGDDINDK